MRIKCPCGKELILTIKKAKRKKYCSLKCFYKYRKRPVGLIYNLQVKNKGWWSKGHLPWNNNTKGIQKANSGSFKKGQRASILTEFKYKNGNGYRYLLKRGILEPICIECKENKINRLHVHHIDYDRTNNKIDNFQVLCRLHHLKKHNRIERVYVEGRKAVWKK